MLYLVLLSQEGEAYMYMWALLLMSKIILLIGFCITCDFSWEGKTFKNHQCDLFSKCQISLCDKVRYWKSNVYISILVYWLIDLWCLTLLSTIFRLYRGSQFYWWREKKRVPRENHRPVTTHRQTLSHNVVSNTPGHEQDSNSQL